MDSSMQAANPAKLFVGNLSYNVTSDQLREKFSEFGTVVDAIVLTDKFSGRSKGFGFVTMGSEQEAQEAITALNEMEWDGRKILVNVARPPAPRENRPFNRGGGGSSSGGFRGGSSRGGGFSSGRNDRGWNN